MKTLIDLELTYLSDSTEIMYSETTGEILRNNEYNGDLERMYSSVTGDLKFGDIYEVELPKHQYRLWETAYETICSEDEDGMGEIVGYIRY